MAWRLRCVARQALVLAALLVVNGSAFSQQIGIGTPFNTINDNFFEQMNIGFGVDLGPNAFFSQGSFDSTIPPVGGFDPNSGARGGFRAGPFTFQFALSSGNSRSLTSTTPYVVMPNGGSGSIFSGAVRPFVTGIVPVVGGLGPGGDGMSVPGMPMPGMSMPGLVTARDHSVLQERIERLRQMPAKSGSEEDARRNEPGKREVLGSAAPASRSTADRGDVSVRDIRRQQAAEDETRRAELEALVERAQGAVDGGKFGAARIYYKRAAKLASSSEERETLLQKATDLQ